MFEFRPIQSCIEFLQPFWIDIDRLWLEKGGLGQLSPFLIDKAFQAGMGKVTGNMLFFHNQPIGMYWVECLTPHYGNMVLHSLQPDCRAILAQHIVSEHLIDDVFAELIQFEDHSDFRAAFVQSGCYENPRQRMGMDLTQYLPQQSRQSPDLSFKLMTRDSIAASSEISCLAHKKSKDYDGYEDLEQVDKRILLEQRVFDGLYGPIIPEASLLLLKNETVVGSCLIVDIKCWGYEHVPWVFDICIDPQHHGKGYGGFLFEEVLRILKEKQFPIVGLAVTLTNKSAIYLYEKTGFEVAEVFHEYTFRKKGKK